MRAKQIKAYAIGRIAIPAVNIHNPLFAGYGDQTKIWNTVSLPACPIALWAVLIIMYLQDTIWVHTALQF
ncbi:hypothetical protein SDC49_02575 [Lactobacillus sp. R2/2]|nr:hypothetical protein [Lactobacillus sp. R2/2]